MSSEYERVKEFNIAAEQECSNSPRAMTKKEVHFLTKMMLDELSEFMVTLYPDYKYQMIKMITDSKDLEFKELGPFELIAEQGDALVDSNYYALNASAKCGIPLDKIFNEVHDANMRKRDQATGKFLRREDGKIIKPEGWKGPDIIKVITDNVDIFDRYHEPCRFYRSQFEKIEEKINGLKFELNISKEKHSECQSKLKYSKELQE